MSKKWFSFLLAGALLLAFATACGNKSKQEGQSDQSSHKSNAPSGTYPTDSNATGQPSSSGNNTTFPDSLANAGRDITVDDLISTLDLKESDLTAAMKDSNTVGDSVTGARTYQHKILGVDATVSYSFSANGKIEKVLIETDKSNASLWKDEIENKLNAKGEENDASAWTYSNAMLKIQENGDHAQITIVKKTA